MLQKGDICYGFVGGLLMGSHQMGIYMGQVGRGRFKAYNVYLISSGRFIKLYSEYVCHPDDLKEKIDWMSGDTSVTER